MKTSLARDNSRSFIEILTNPSGQKTGMHVHFGMCNSVRLMNRCPILVSMNMKTRKSVGVIQCSEFASGVPNRFRTAFPFGSRSVRFANFSPPEPRSSSVPVRFANFQTAHIIPWVFRVTVHSPYPPTQASRLRMAPVRMKLSFAQSLVASITGLV